MHSPLRMSKVLVLVLCLGVTGIIPMMAELAEGCHSLKGLVHVDRSATHKRYRTAPAEIGVRPYIDRRYTISSITPALAGGILVRTAMDDKWFQGDDLFTLTVDQDAYVYVCYDVRGAGSRPTWLSDAAWGDPIPSESVTTTDGSASPMAVYSRPVGAGVPITLGGNHAGGDTRARSNYFVVVSLDKPESQLLEIVSVSSHRPYRLAETKRWAHPYTDRRYKIKHLSPELEGAVLVRTANNDKHSRADVHLGLYANRPVTLYVAYDRRGRNGLPAWLSGWKDNGLTISTSDWPASPMMVFEKTFAGDQIIDLPGNKYDGGERCNSNYFVMAKADEPWKRQALLVHGGRSLNFNDQLVKSRLETRGMAVLTRTDREVEAADADGKALIVISETVYSKRVGTLFTDVSIPIICWEPYLYDDLGLTGGEAGVDYGHLFDHDSVFIESGDQPLSGGLNGTVPVREDSGRLAFGVPGDAAQIAATAIDDAEKALLFAYDTHPDAILPGGFPAPARRVGLFLYRDTARRLTREGKLLLEAALDYALGTESLKILSDATWKVSDEEMIDWQMPDFDDSVWRHAMSPYPNSKPADHCFRVPGTNADYMWDAPLSGAPNGRNGPKDVWFRKTFELPVDPAEVVNAVVTIGVDDVFDLYINGEPIFADWNGVSRRAPFTVNILPHLIPGRNVLAVYGSDAFRGREWALVEATVEWAPAEPQRERDWVIMAYLSGDNANGEWVAEDLQELEYGLALAEMDDPEIDAKLAVVVQFDGAAEGDSVRYRIRPDPVLDTVVVSDVLEPLGEVNMGDPETLTAFIQFCKLEFPARHYALILSNHGPAAASPLVQGVAPSPAKYLLWDDQGSETDRLYVGEITDGLTPEDTVAVFGLDTGFMGTLETAYEFRPADDKFGADYLTASPGRAIADGWAYDAVLPMLGDVSSLTPEQLAAALVDAYEAGVIPTGSEEPGVSAFDLSVIGNVKIALDSLAQQTGMNASAWYKVRGYARSGPEAMEYFNDIPPQRRIPPVPDIETESSWLKTPVFDLYDVAGQLKDMNGMFRAGAENLMAAIESCVVASYGYTVREQPPTRVADIESGRHGMGFFFPDGRATVYRSSPAYHYQYHWWYAAEDTLNWPQLNSVPNYRSDLLYGKLDFCTPGITPGQAETWWELLQRWYNITPLPY